jgi:predicted O-methyltransferase YrrM
MSYKNVLTRLHKEADEKDGALHERFTDADMKIALSDPKTFYRNLKTEYLAIDETFGEFLYMSARMSRAKTIVEFGTSFGISTIYLAQALKDNGGGKLITTEYEADKIAIAKANIQEAGLSDYVEFRQGDAMKSLEGFEGEIDILFLDGAKNLYVPLLKLLESNFRSGTFIASDNSKMSPDFVVYLKGSERYLSTDISGKQDNELAIWR